MSAVFNASFNLSYEVVLAGLVCTVITSVTSANKSLELCSDVCLEAEASPRCFTALPRLVITALASSLNKSLQKLIAFACLYFVLLCIHVHKARAVRSYEKN